MRDKNPLLQPERTTQILLSQYGLGYASKGGGLSGLSIPKEVIEGMEGEPVRVHAIYGVCCE